MFSSYQSTTAGQESLPKKRHSTFLEKVRVIVEANYDNPYFGVDELTRAIPISHSQLYRKIKSLTGLSSALYLRKLRLQKSVDLLKNTDLTISEIAYEVGFSDPAYFSRIFTTEHKMCPMVYRRCNNNLSL